MNTLSSLIETLLWGGQGNAPVWVSGSYAYGDGVLNFNISPADIITVIVFILSVYSIYRIIGSLIRRVNGW